MKKYLIESAKIVNSNLIYIFVLALLRIQIFSIDMMPFTVIGFIMSLILAPAIYGRFSELVTGEQQATLTGTFKKHWFNFYVVSLILAFPVIIFTFFFGKLQATQIGIAMKYAISVTISGLTIYVRPLVFLKRKNFSTIPLGIKYLFTNFKYSLPLVFLVFLIFVVKVLAAISATLFFQGNLFVLIPIGYIHNVLTLYLSFTIFITACIILIKFNLKNR